MKFERIWIAAAAVSMALAAPALAQQAGKPLKPESLLTWKWPGDPQITPDGKRVAYVLLQSAEDGTKYSGDIWVAEPAAGAPRPLTTHPAHDRNPRWSPDGKRLAFLSNRSGKTQVWILETEGEPWQLTDSTADVGSFAWSPDGLRIALVANPPKPGEDKPDYKAPKQVVFTTERLVFRNDGTPGFRTEDINQVWTVALPADRSKQKPTQITRDAYPHNDLNWSADGRRIFFTANDKPDPEYVGFDSEILSVPADGSAAPRRETDRRGGDDTPRISPDGKLMAWFGFEAGDKLKAYDPDVLYIRELGSSAAPRAVELPHAVGDSVTTDSAPPKLPSNSMAWSRDGRAIYVRAAHEGRTHLLRVDPKTLKVETVDKSLDGDIAALSVGGDKVAVLYANPTSPGDIYLMDAKGAAQRVTTHGQDDVRGAAVGAVRERWVNSFDGQRIQYWIVTPPGFDQSKKYPAILYIHGGPHAMYGETFFHEFQVLANAGYVVVYGNPRGSTGYGGQFGNVIQHKYPGDDAKDLIATVDDAATLGFIDTNRLGVAGGSGGGVLSSWLVGTYPDKFKAAVVERAVVDWRQMAGSDIPLVVTQQWFDQYPWQNPQTYWERSPISLVEKVKAPVLIIHNAEDYRVPIGQAYDYYQSLKMLRKPAKLAVFPASSHGMSRDGTPEQRIERLKLITAWFDGYLK